MPPPTTTTPPPWCAQPHRILTASPAALQERAVYLLRLVGDVRRAVMRAALRTHPAYLTRPPAEVGGGWVCEAGAMFAMAAPAPACPSPPPPQGAGEVPAHGHVPPPSAAAAQVEQWLLDVEHLLMVARPTSVQLLLCPQVGMQQAVSRGRRQGGAQEGGAPGGGGVGVKGLERAKGRV